MHFVKAFNINVLRNFESSRHFLDGSVECSSYRAAYPNLPERDGKFVRDGQWSNYRPMIECQLYILHDVRNIKEMLPVKSISNIKCLLLKSDKINALSPNNCLLDAVPSVIVFITKSLSARFL